MMRARLLACQSGRHRPERTGRPNVFRGYGPARLALYWRRRLDVQGAATARDVWRLEALVRSEFGDWSGDRPLRPVPADRCAGLALPGRTPEETAVGMAALIGRHLLAGSTREAPLPRRSRASQCFAEVFWTGTVRGCWDEVERLLNEMDEEEEGGREGDLG